MTCSQCCKNIYLQLQPLYMQLINEENQQSMEVQIAKCRNQFTKNFNETHKLTNQMHFEL
jgi:hypothetical protein